ncbi:hypothetical protein ACH4L7_33360 [Streptomyces anulatus]
MSSAARRCAPGEDVIREELGIIRIVVIREELGIIRIERVLTDNAWA